MEFTDRELELAKKIAHKQASNWKLVDPEDLQASLNLWLVKKYQTVLRYRTQDGGEGALYKSLNREAARLAHKETMAIMHTNELKSHTYTRVEIANALPYLWTWRDAILMNDAADNRIEDIMLDIEAGFSTLSDTDKQLIEARFKHAKRYVDIAVDLGITKQAARNRVMRVVDKIKIHIG